MFVKMMESKQVLAVNKDNKVTIRYSSSHLPFTRYLKSPLHEQD